MAPTAQDVRRVPVEHRWLGLDRRSIPYGLVAFAVIALWAWVMPWVDSQVAWDDTTSAGEAFQVTTEVSMTVPPGWGVQSGLRTVDEPHGGDQAREVEQTVLVKDGVVFAILQGPFGESPTRLLDQANRITGAQNSGYHVSGETHNVTTAAGLRGVTQDFTSPTGAGSVTAFVVDGQGIEIQVAGPQEQLSALESEVRSMIDSLAQDGASPDERHGRRHRRRDQPRPGRARRAPRGGHRGVRLG
ncbi:hypothetical protein [Nocardioides sambongensis]|uniref:hypothetical protein n=1 Tax=Nocardioides sambongensis TaxID=2589074 RepID=UPI00112778B4|nr:hypothetical protein [Nocardioides sambongensis]